MKSYWITAQNDAVVESKQAGPGDKLRLQINMWGAVVAWCSTSLSIEGTMV